MPVKGLNFVENVMTMSPEYAFILDNFIARPWGVEVRKGWRYWLPLPFAYPVKTVMVMNGKVTANTKLFCSTGEPASTIYDITTTNVAPVVSLTPSTPPIVPGEWYFTNFVAPGNVFLCIVAAGAGYYMYSNPSGWVEVVLGDGVTPNTIKFPVGDTTTTKDLAFIWTWKNRVWFLKKDSAVAYYLPLGQLYGELETFDFGPQLINGGSLAFGTNWTYDAGSGMDDSLVLASTQGDVLIYQGTDPADITKFALKGCWYAGRMPYGRRNFCPHGGNVLIATEYGVITVADLVAGRIHTSDLAYGGLGGMLNPRIANFISSSIDQPYWFLIPCPTQEVLLVGTPFVDPFNLLLQTYAMNSLSNAWSTFTNVEMHSADMYRGKLIYGTVDGKVIEGLTGYRDGDDSAGTVLGDTVIGRMQTAFNDYETPNLNKTMKRAKIYGRVGAQPSLHVSFLSEYNFVISPAPETSTEESRALWDIALWDVSNWGADVASLNRWFGVAAFGKRMSLRLAARGANSVLLSDYEACFAVGTGF